LLIKFIITTTKATRIKIFRDASGKAAEFLFLSGKTPVFFQQAILKTDSILFL